jgi:hypothetical protein
MLSLTIKGNDDKVHLFKNGYYLGAVGLCEDIKTRMSFDFPIEVVIKREEILTAQDRDAIACSK